MKAEPEPTPARARAAQSDGLRDLQERHERLNRLHQVSHIIYSTLEPQEALRLIVREAIRLVRATCGSVALVNPTNRLLEIHAAEGLPAPVCQVKLRVGEGLTGWVAREGQPARIGDVDRDPRYVRLRADVRSEMAVPLEADGEVFGVLNVDSEQPDAFTAGDQELLEAFAVAAARVIRHTWRYEQLRLRTRLLESLVGIGQTIQATLNLDEALRAITREACQLMRGKLCALLLLDERRENLELRASHGAGEGYLRKPPLSVADSLLGAVMRRKKPLQVENVQTSSQYQHVEIARQEGLVSWLSVPLLFQGEAIGTLSVYTAEPHVFSNDEIRTLSALAGLSAIAIEKARLYERLVDVEEEVRQHEKLSALGLLAAEVAHEIRNPLTVMKMLYHSLDLRFPAGDPRARDAAMIGEKMDRLNRIVEQVLDFARSAEPQFGPVDVNRLLEDLALLTRHKLRNQHIELARKFDPDLPVLKADATQLEQAFLNLTLNAVQAMPEGGRLTITTRVTPPASPEREARRVLIEFRDTGEGMSRERQARALTPLLGSSKSRGTGLGLAIVRRVVETHRGELRIKSQPGRGTTVSLILTV